MERGTLWIVAVVTVAEASAGARAGLGTAAAGAGAGAGGAAGLTDATAGRTGAEAAAAVLLWAEDRKQRN